MSTRSIYTPYDIYFLLIDIGISICDMTYLIGYTLYIYISYSIIISSKGMDGSSIICYTCNRYIIDR